MNSVPEKPANAREQPRPAQEKKKNDWISVCQEEGKTGTHPAIVKEKVRLSARETGRKKNPPDTAQRHPGARGKKVVPA